MSCIVTPARMLMCQVRLPLDALPFFSNFIALWLSLYTTLSEAFISCAPRKYSIHNIWGIGSSTPTNSASVELSVFRFCLFEVEYRAPCPIVIIPPVWIFMSWCTTNSASAHHFTVPVPSYSKVSTRYLVPLRYFSMRDNFLSSSLSGSLNHIVRKATPVRISARACLHRNINFP